MSPTGLKFEVWSFAFSEARRQSGSPARISRRRCRMDRTNFPESDLRTRTRHQPGRQTTRRNRPESTFDADVVFAAAARFDKAIEINCLPDRLDPPKRLLRLAVESGCRVSIDSDAHYLGQLAWVRVGCERGFLSGVTPDIVVNALPVDELLEWTASHESG